MKLTSHSIDDTQKIARSLARKILEKRIGKHATILALEGELGAGKTTFVKGFAKALGVRAHITSPTFVIIKNYKLKIKNYNLLIHLDAYRLKNFRDLLPLGIREAIAEPTSIILIEWSERVEPILPQNYIKVHIDHVSKNTRKIIISNFK